MIIAPLTCGSFWKAPPRDRTFHRARSGFRACLTISMRVVGWIPASAESAGSSTAESLPVSTANRRARPLIVATTVSEYMPRKAREWRFGCRSAPDSRDLPQPSSAEKENRRAPERRAAKPGPIEKILFVLFAIDNARPGARGRALRGGLVERDVQNRFFLFAEDRHGEGLLFLLSEPANRLGNRSR